MWEAVQIVWHYSIQPNIKGLLMGISYAQVILTLVGTAVSAFAGVLGAQLISERFKRKDSLLDEIRATNAAIMTSFEICNSMINLKDQQTRDITKHFNETADRFKDFDERQKTGKLRKNEKFEFEANFRTLNPMLMPSEILTKQVYEQISAGKRAYALTGLLVRSVDSLNLSIAHRNNLISKWLEQASPRSPEEKRLRQKELVCFYFGVPDSEGHINTSYPESIKAISSLTDDCIQFSKMLCADLNAHGESLRAKLGKRSPEIHSPNFDGAKRQGLLPDESQFRDLIEMSP